MRIVLALLALISFGPAWAQTVPDREPEELIRFVYEQYVGKKTTDSMNFDWIKQPMAGRLFEPTLARAVVKAGASPEPVIDFDPFIDAQDFEIASYDLKTEGKTADRARVIATFKNMNEPKTVRYDMRRTKDGWRIRDIDWGRGRQSFRRMLKVR